MEKSSYQIFYEEAPEQAEAFNQVIQSISMDNGLDNKTRQLIYIGIKASQGQTEAVVAHVPMAKEAGASKEEVKNTILLTLTVSGITGVLKCLGPALEAYG